VCARFALARLPQVAIFILSLGYLGLDAIATEMEQPFGDDLNDLPVLEVVERVEKGVRILMQQLDRDKELAPFKVRPFFKSGSKEA